MSVRVKFLALLLFVLAFGSVAAVVQVEPDQAPSNGIDNTGSVSEESAFFTSEEIWTVRSGTITFSYHLDVMADWGLSISEADSTAAVPPDEPLAQAFVIDPLSTLTFSVVNGSLRAFLDGQILLLGNPTLINSEGEYLLNDLMIAPVGDEAQPTPLSAIWQAKPLAGDTGGLLLQRVLTGFNTESQTLTIHSGELLISPTLAKVMGDPKLADLVLGTVTIHADAERVGGAEPDRGEEEPPPGDQGGARASKCDMTFCQLYGLYQCSGARLGDIVGLGVATTSWNIGDGDCIWWNIPDEEHPFIQQNLFRLKTVDGSERFEQIGMANQKDGFYALSSHQCGGPACTYEPGHGPGGNWLGMGCTDTYGASLNCGRGSNGKAMGANYERNAWTAYWYYPGSHQYSSHGHDAIEHRLQVHDADLDPPQNPGATYYCEGYYLMIDDMQPMNSASWKPVTINSGAPGGTWQFGMSGYGTYPNIGFAIDAWTGAQQTIIAQEIPVKRFRSPDGRCVLAAKATDLGGGIYHYEYALTNVDMDRQVGSFSIPISSSMSITNVGFYGVEHHDEDYNTADPDAVPIDNAPWVWQVTSDAITWSTTTNPLRWAMMFNFRFDANAPSDMTTVTLGLFRPGSPSTLTGQTYGPELTPLDCNGNGIPDDCDIDCGPPGGDCDVAGCGGSQDCNGNLVPDECDISGGTSSDCNGNGIPDECDISGGTSDDCNNNGIPDECEWTDCNNNGVLDECDISGGTSDDCNNNGIPDECDIAQGSSLDCNNNGVPDECDISGGTSDDCNNNGIPDECEWTDCNNNGVLDECDISSGTSDDCDGGPVGFIADGANLHATHCAACHGPDGSGGVGPDIRDSNRVELWNALLPPTTHPGGAFPGFSQQDFADIEAFLATGGSRGRPDQVPDECQSLDDCDGDSTSDGCELEAGTQEDLNYNGIPDVCEYPYGDVDQSGETNLYDLLCLLDGLGDLFTCADVTINDLDIFPCGGGDESLDLNDLTAMLDTIRGMPPCQ